MEIDERPDENYDSEQLGKGIEIELEHTKTIRKIAEVAGSEVDDELIRQISKMITKDHLDEMPDYYDKLETIEPPKGEDTKPETGGSEENEIQQISQTVEEGY